jgi:hypothetical protein
LTISTGQYPEKKTQKGLLFKNKTLPLRERHINTTETQGNMNGLLLQLTSLLSLPLSLGIKETLMALTLAIYAWNTYLE